MMQQAAPVPSWGALFKGDSARLFIILSFGIWVHAADSTLIASLLPRVVDDIGGAEFLSWNFVVYKLAQISAACGAVLAARRFGLRRAMTAAAGLVALGCLISAMTPTMEGMLVGRTVQGTGGGILMACTIIGVGSLFPSSFTPRIMAAISAVWGSSAALGPLAGGVFAEFGYWRLGFGVFVVQALILGIALWRVLPDHRDERSHTSRTQEPLDRFPYRRLMVLSGGVMAIATGAVVDSSQIGLLAALFALGILLLGLFLRLDMQAGGNRMLPKDIVRPFSGAGAGFIGIFLIMVASISFTSYGPTLMDRLHGIGPLGAGYMVALEAVSWSIGALALSGLVGVWQTWAIRVSFIVITVATGALAFVTASGPIWAILLCLFVLGLGFGASFGHVVQRCTEAVVAEDRDRAGGAMTTMQGIGYALGASICGLIANQVGFAETRAGDEATAFWIFAVMLVPAGISVFLIHFLAKPTQEVDRA